MCENYKGFNKIKSIWKLYCSCWVFRIVPCIIGLDILNIIESVYCVVCIGNYACNVSPVFFYSYSGSADSHI